MSLSVAGRALWPATAMAHHREHCEDRAARVLPSMLRAVRQRPRGLLHGFRLSGRQRLLDNLVHLLVEFPGQTSLFSAKPSLLFPERTHAAAEFSHLSS